MSMNASLGMSAGQKQVLGHRLSQTQVHGLKLLGMSLPALRAELAAELSRNPAIEDFDHPLETSLSEVQRAHDEAETEADGDFPAERFEPTVGFDEDAAERRQRFFDNQVATETLQQHLMAQLPTSDIPRDDWPLAAVLVGDLDDDGFYRGALPDVCMAFGRDEKVVRAILAEIRAFDPPGCGATSARECLLAQTDALGTGPDADAARAIIDGHLEDLAAGRTDAICRALGVTSETLAAAVRLIRTLNAHPGRAFPGEHDRVEYVNPEVHAVKIDGRWCAMTDRRSLPKLRLSKSFMEMLGRDDLDEKTKAYVRERIAAAQALGEAVTERCDTVEAVAQAIFDRQQDFFEKGFPALKPLTQSEIARTLDLAESTVSRTVNDKYASTPFGTVGLQAFFVTGVANAAGEVVSQEAVLDALREIVDAEDKAAPLSDEKLAAALKARGFSAARRTVAKYRGLLGIPAATARG